MAYWVKSEESIYHTYGRQSGNELQFKSVTFSGPFDCWADAVIHIESDERNGLEVWEFESDDPI